jgi:hypothetical protein
MTQSPPVDARPSLKSDPEPLMMNAIDLYSTAFASIVARYHSALSFGVRFCVLKST